MTRELRIRQEEMASWKPRGSFRMKWSIFLGFPGGSGGEESDCNMGDLGWEDPLEMGKVTHSSILAWRITWTVPWGHKESDMTE